MGIEQPGNVVGRAFGFQMIEDAQFQPVRTSLARMGAVIMSYRRP
jgi:hypothetical protein